MVKRGMILMTLPYAMLTTALDSPNAMTVNPIWYVPKHSEIYIWSVCMCAHVSMCRYV